MDDAGFERVTPLADALERLRELCAFHGRTAACALADADGRVLAEDLRARRDVPHYDRAAMDGYAVRAEDTFDATARSPVRLDVVDAGVAEAGAADDGPADAGAVGDAGGDDPSDAADEPPVEPGTARQVHTGSPVPDGADAVVKVERTERDGDELRVAASVAVGENVAAAGEDVSAGERLFGAGHRLRASDLALLRAAGVETVTVAERPRVAVVPTGDEVVPADAEPAPGEVVGTNGPLVSRLAESWGASATGRDVVPDDAAALRAALDRDADHDLVVTTGGSSVGERDLLPDALAERSELLVHGLAIKPGHPAGFGHVDGTPVLLLPGYPVSCLVTAVQLLRPAVAWTAGGEPDPLPSVPAELSEKLPSEPGERTFARVRLTGVADQDAGGGTVDGDPDAGNGTVDGDPDAGDGAGHADPDVASSAAAGAEVGAERHADSTLEDLPRAEPVRVGGAGVLSSVAAADGWVVVPESREGIPAGERVAVQRWE